MQFDDMYNEVIAYYPKAEISPTEAKKYVNRAYMELAESFQFYEIEKTDESIVTASGTAEYDLPDRAFDVITMRDITNKVDLIPETIQFYEQMDTSGDITSIPEFYVLYGDGKFLLWPTPGDEYTLRLRYKELPAELVADTDGPVYPVQWHEVIILLAAGKAGMVAGFDSKAINLKNNALGKINALQERHVQNARRRIGQVSIQRTRRRSGGDTSRHAEFL